MVIRKLSEDRFNRFHDTLMTQADAEPLDASYTVRMVVNGAEYMVKVQPEYDNKIAVLQALRMYREKDGPNFELITTSRILLSLLELMLYQGIRRPPNQ